MEGEIFIHETRIMVLIFGEVKVDMPRDAYMNLVEICVRRFRPVSYVERFT